ncbi:24710_t:CDS:2, partial [Gigaspora margarita]
EEAVVGAGLGIRGGVLRGILTKGELGSSRSSGSNRVVIDWWVIKEEMPSRRRIGDTAKLLRLEMGDE